MTRVPASTEMMSGRAAARVGARGLSTACASCGFTASTTTSAPAIAASLSAARRDAELACERLARRRDTLAHAQLLGARARAHEAGEQGAADVARAEDA